MIDAKAVWAGVVEGGRGAGETEWVRAAVEGTPLEVQAGSGWLRLRGTGERTVVLGSSVARDVVQDGAARRYGLVVGVEVLKGLARKFAGAAPCGVVVLLPGEALPPEGVGAVSAYLELQLAGVGEGGGAALGVAATGEAMRLSPRLQLLGEEAVDELAGVSAAVPLEASETLKAAVEAGVPAAAMVVRSAGAGEAELPETERLHLLQAAEAFGRWAEATVHLLAGDAVDLWAVEHRVPRGERRDCESLHCGTVRLRSR